MRFWGVRGSIACPGPDTLRYGGNTPCVEMRCGERVLVFDAGTGIRRLGDDLAARGVDDIDVFFSHTHIDHVVGMPFFGFAFHPGNRARVWGGHLLPDRTIESAIRAFMSAPLFPVPLDVFRARVAFEDFRAGERLDPHAGISVGTGPLRHPDGATGYRVEYGGKAVCYVTDTQHAPGTPDADILTLIEGADVVIYDATFTDEEFPRYADWGHSTWQECLRLCRRAGVRTPVMFHHLPDRDDDALDRIAEAAAQAFPGAVVAREGMTLSP